MIKVLNANELPAGFIYKINEDFVVVSREGNDELFIVKNNGLPKIFKIEPPPPGQNIVVEVDSEQSHEPAYKCGNCGEKVAQTTDFCFDCLQRLKKQGICMECKKNPIYREGRVKLDYCAQCATHKGIFPRRVSGIGRSPEYRELTFETKFGTGHG